MRVRIVESRQHQPPAHIDGARGGVAFEQLLLAHGNDGPGADDDRRRGAVPIIERNDLAVVQNQVGGFPALLRLCVANDEGRQQEDGAGCAHDAV